MKYSFLKIAILALLSVGCKNQPKKAKETPLYITKEMEALQKKLEMPSSERLAQKTAFYKDIQKQTVALQKRVSKK